MKISAQIRGERVAEGFRAAPSVLIRHLEGKMARGAEEVAREMRREAPKAFSALVNSIRVERVAELHYWAGPNVNYDRLVEDGRPAGKMPGTANGLMEWVRLRTKLTGKPLDRAAFAIARAIGRRGIKPQPYVAPTAEKMSSRVQTLMDEGVEDGLKEVFA